MANESLSDLKFMIGKWDMELLNASFLASPTETIKGLVEMVWIEDGAFIVLRQNNASRWLINRDNVNCEYKVFYFDNRGLSRIYNMSFKKNVWKMWRENNEFSQRFTATVSKDLRIMNASWDKKFGEKDWEHDFDMLFKKSV